MLSDGGVVPLLDCVQEFWKMTSKTHHDLYCVVLQRAATQQHKLTAKLQVLQFWMHTAGRDQGLDRACACDQPGQLRIPHQSTQGAPTRYSLVCQTTTMCTRHWANQQEQPDSADRSVDFGIVYSTMTGHALSIQVLTESTLLTCFQSTACMWQEFQRNDANSFCQACQ